MDKYIAQMTKVMEGIAKDTKKEIIAKLQALKSEAETKEEKVCIQKCIDAAKADNTVAENE